MRHSETTDTGGGFELDFESGIKLPDFMPLNGVLRKRHAVRVRLWGSCGNCEILVDPEVIDALLRYGQSHHNGGDLIHALLKKARG